MLLRDVLLTPQGDNLVHAQNRRMIAMLTTTLIDHVGRLDAEELDRLQAAIDARRRELAGRESTAPMSTVLERRPHGSGVLQLEMRSGSGPY